MKTLVLVSFIFSAMINAQITWEPTYNLSNTPSSTSDYHSVHSDGMGNYYVVWGDNGEIKFKRSGDFGNTWSPNQILFSSGTSGWPVVKSENNYVYVVFHHLASEYELIFLTSSDYGQTWSSTQAPAGLDAGSITPQMAVYNSNVYLVWEQKIGTVNPSYDIYFIKSTNRGSTWSNQFNISNSPGSNSRWVQLEVVGNTLYCAWLESITYPASDIYFSKSEDGGESWWLTPPNITNNARPQNRIYMKANENNGDIYIASDDIITFNFDEIYLMKSTDGGSSWSTPINITNNSGNSNTPCIDFVGDYLYFTWADNSHTAPAYDNMDIFFKWSSDDGLTWQDSINLSNNAESSSRPRICSTLFVTLQGVIWSDFTVVWYDYSTGDAEILARRGNQFIVPVELTSFEAEVNNKSVLLKWATASELNNRGFEIERCEMSNSKSENWKKIGFVGGFGTTTENKFYSYSDENLQPGLYSYRLKQIDYDGSFEYSDVIEVNIETIYDFALSQNYPNPFNPTTKIKYTIPSVTLSDAEGSLVTLTIFDILGKKITVLVNEVKPAGSYEVEFDGSELSSGIYYYQLTAGTYSEVRKMMLLK